MKIFEIFKRIDRNIEDNAWIHVYITLGIIIFINLFLFIVSISTCLYHSKQSVIYWQSALVFIIILLLFSLSLFFIKKPSFKNFNIMLAKCSTYLSLTFFLLFVLVLGIILFNSNYIYIFEQAYISIKNLYFISFFPSSCCFGRDSIIYAIPIFLAFYIPVMIIVGVLVYIFKRKYLLLIELILFHVFIINSMFYPEWNHTRSPASRIKANMHTLQTMIETYAIDYKGKYPRNIEELKKDADLPYKNYWKELWNPYIYKNTMEYIASFTQNKPIGDEVYTIYKDYNIYKYPSIFYAVNKKRTKYWLTAINKSACYSTWFIGVCEEYAFIKDKGKIFYLTNWGKDDE